MFIKVTDEAIAKSLIVMGFTYMTECVCGKCTYIFEQTPELMKNLTMFGNTKLIEDDRLRF